MLLSTSMLLLHLLAPSITDNGTPPLRFLAWAECQCSPGLEHQIETGGASSLWTEQLQTVSLWRVRTAAAGLPSQQYGSQPIHFCCNVYEFDWFWSSRAPWLIASPCPVLGNAGWALNPLSQTPSPICTCFYWTCLTQGESVQNTMCFLLWTEMFSEKLKYFLK